jgi:single-stranded-DNA-specific exonuclease
VGSSSASTRWTICERLDQKPLDPQAENPSGKKLLDLYREARIDPLHAQLLYNRGLRTPAEMLAFLNARLDQIPDPLRLTDMERALPRIRRALNQREHITVFGDFDADGVTSAALLTRALRRLGQAAQQLSVYIPSRLLGQRGLSREAIDILHARGTTLIITSDCGTSDVEEVHYAQELGIDVIITDHHHPPALLPQPLALINTWRLDSTYGERYLCGVGTAFKLAQALYREAGHEQEVWELLDLVAIGTVGDVVPLLGENHTLVRAGMRQLNQTRNPGLQALFQAARLQPGKIRERDISFVLAPRINAAGRMKDAELAFRLLTTDDSAEAFALAAELEQLNASRQQQTEELMKLVRAQAELQADKQVILVYGEQASWPEGIIGLVAGKLADETHRPAFVLSQGARVSRGSARSQENFNIILALQAARPHLFERFGGHAQAAGFTIANEHIAELHQHLLRWQEEPGASLTIAVAETAQEAAVDLNGETEPPPVSRKVDLVIGKPERLTMEMLNKINQLSPFGAGNPEPVFQLDNVVLQRRWLSGSEGRHLRMRLRAHNQIFTGTLLRGGPRAETLKEDSLVTIIFSLEQAWSPQGSEPRQEIGLKVLDIQPVNA